MSKNSSPTSVDGSRKKCYRCNGQNHLAIKSKIVNADCRKCHRIRHIAAACRNGKVPCKSLHSAEESNSV